MAKKVVSKKKVALGVGLSLAAVAAAGAGYFFYGSKDAVKNRKKAAAWSQKLHADVLKKAKKIKKLDEKALRTIVDESTRAYEKVKSIDKANLQKAAKELKGNWKHISAEISRVAKKETKVVKSPQRRLLQKQKVLLQRKQQRKLSPKRRHSLKDLFVLAYNL